MAHTGQRLRQWLGRKYRVQGPQQHAIRTATCARSWDWCGSQNIRSPASCGRKQESLSESRMREIRLSGSMKREWDGAWRDS